MSVLRCLPCACLWLIGYRVRRMREIRTSGVTRGGGKLPPTLLLFCQRRQKAYTPSRPYSGAGGGDAFPQDGVTFVARLKGAYLVRNRTKARFDAAKSKQEPRIRRISGFSLTIVLPFRGNADYVQYLILKSS